MTIDRQPGLYNKYIVARNDGRDRPGGDRANARYFVLDVANDPVARTAMVCYIDAVKYSKPELAHDLERLLEEVDG